MIFFSFLPKTIKKYKVLVMTTEASDDPTSISKFVVLFQVIKKLKNIDAVVAMVNLVSTIRYSLYGRFIKSFKRKALQIIVTKAKHVAITIVT